METWVQYMVQAVAIVAILLDAVYGQSSDDPASWDEWN